MSDARLVRVRGRVQGVGYRWACVQKARELGIAGWGRNRTDGSVEALLQGSNEQLDAMCAWMRSDVPGASVSGMDIEDAPAGTPEHGEFRQVATA